MKNNLSTLVACALTVSSSWLTVALAGTLRDADILKPPIRVAVKQGLDAPGPCAGLIVKVSEYESCVIAAQQRDAKKGGDNSLYDLGLYFDTWYTMDTLARPNDDSPTPDALKQSAVAAKPLAAKYFKLYKESQKKVAVTDDQLIALFQLNEPQLLKARIATATRETGR